MKKILFYFLLAVFTAWVFLPSTLLIKESDKVEVYYSPDREYKAVVYHTAIISPFSFYKWLQNESYFFILYDYKGNVIFKPSIFYGTSSLTAYDKMRFLYDDKNYFIYPVKEGHKSIRLD